MKETLVEKDIALSSWREQEKQSLELLSILGDLRFDKNVELIYFHHNLYDTRPSELLNTLRFSEKYTTTPISVNVVLEITQTIAKIDLLAPSKIDLGKLAMKWLDEQKGKGDLSKFINTELIDHVGTGKKVLDSRDVVLYGFGRIGRLLARIITMNTGKGDQLRLRAIVLRSKLADRAEEMRKRASLLEKDSVHNEFQGVVDIDVEKEELIINGNRVKMIFAGSPEDVDYTTYGISNALVVDNTGMFRDKAGLSRHLRPGATQVMLTAPGSDIPNIVHGINQQDLNFREDNVISAASCTTNAIAPVIKVVYDNLGIEKGHIETIHAYTNDQNLIDNFHKKPRRGRGAPLNMVLTTTGAAKAVAKVIPELSGILTGNAVRVPTPNVSLAIMNLTLDKATTLEDLKELLRNSALHGKLVEQIHYSTDTELVSSDVVGHTTTSVVDAPSTIVSKDGKNVTIYAWYDNEFGYSCQVVRLAKYISQVRRLRYY